MNLKRLVSPHTTSDNANNYSQTPFPLSLLFPAFSFRVKLVSRSVVRIYLWTLPPTPPSASLHFPAFSRLFLFPLQLLVAGARSHDVIFPATRRFRVLQQMGELKIWEKVLRSEGKGVKKSRFSTISQQHVATCQADCKT